MSFKKFLKEYFGYSRRERYGSLVLVIILLAVIIIRIFNVGGIYERQSIPEENIPFTGEQSQDGETRHKDSLFIFDPNTASGSELVVLGLSERQAQTVINYRNTGARFRKADDFRRIYGISDSLFDRLIPFIRISKIDNDRDGKSSYQIGSSLSREAKKTENGEAALDSLAEKAHSGRAKRTAVRPKQLDINSIDSCKLEQLRGIGPVLASRIVRYRELLGCFYSPRQLYEVYGLDSSTVLMHLDRFYCDTTMLKRININTAGYTELLRHPYIEKRNVDAIMAYRRLAGNIDSITQFFDNRIFNTEQYRRLRPYLYPL
ncbi:MAG: helix-hairpin-helix domain-containing protein [Bacteroidales bacterium]|nr:helix-hairpin-helix domain-containing protein [Bacteroidales bacterium]